MSRERVRYRQTLRAGRCWVAGGVGPQSQSAGGYAPSSRLASNPPSPGALIPITEREALDEFGEPDCWRAWEANHESGSDPRWGNPAEPQMNSDLVGLVTPCEPFCCQPAGAHAARAARPTLQTKIVSLQINDLGGQMESVGVRKDESEVLELQGPQKSTKARQSRGS